MGNKCCLEVHQKHNNSQRSEIILEPSPLNEQEPSLDVNDSRAHGLAKINENAIQKQKKIDYTNTESVSPRSGNCTKTTIIATQPLLSNSAKQSNNPSGSSPLSQETPLSHQQETSPQQIFYEETDQQQMIEANQMVLSQFDALFKIIEQMQSSSMREVPLISNSQLLTLKTDKIYKMSNCGDYYVGSFNSLNQKEGLGRYFGKNGIFYEGQWKEDQFEGKGIYVELDKICLKGSFHSNLSNGNCIYVKLKEKSKQPNLFFYLCFEEQQPLCGRVEEIDSSNKNEGTQNQSSVEGGDSREQDSSFQKLIESRYKGEMQNGHKHGHGELIIEKVLRYVGCFVKDQFDGYGICQYENGQLYQGHWQRNKRNGSGQERWTSGREYSGEYLNDKFHGYGELIFENGDSYEGFWKEDKMDGKGILKQKGGNQILGEWEQGVLQNNGQVLK